MFKRKPKLPELYDQPQLDALEAHIKKYFGDFPSVMHEIISPDIHVDICMIPPTEQRNYYTLITMGMGAHQMNVPKQLRKSNFDRAELIITLPPDWQVQNNDEMWYWPLRWLKILARLPGEYKTWLGYGHTVPAGEPFAENTQLSGVMLTLPDCFAEEAAMCQMPNGDVVRFYQVLAIYDEEMNYKLENSAEQLQARFPDGYDGVVDISRERVV